MKKVRLGHRGVKHVQARMGHMRWSLSGVSNNGLSEHGPINNYFFSTMVFLAIF